MIRNFTAFLLFLTLTACGLTPPKPQTLDEGVDVQWGFISVMTSAAYSRYYHCRENADSVFERQACIDEGRDAHELLEKADKSLVSVDSVDDLDGDLTHKLRVLRAALAPHIVPSDRAQLEVLDQ